MKILHLEDNALDAALTHPQFQEEWPDCQIELVDNRAAFSKKLSTEKFDFILSDFNLVGFDGLEALKLAHDQIPNTPFIFFSGTIGEERAVEALRSGATDYVIKDRPKRLMAAVRRALSDAQLAKERRAAEEQMLRVQRLENVGMLAAGIAHDINNVLAPIMMGVTLLQDRHTGDLDQKILASMESSAARGAGMVKQILGFAHGVTGEAQLIDPRHLIRDLVGMMHQTFPKNIEIRDETPKDLWPIKANPTQFHHGCSLNRSVRQRPRCDARGRDAQAGGQEPGIGRGQRVGHPWDQAWELPLDGDQRHGHRHTAGYPSQDLGALLHDQGARPGNGPGPGHRAGHHA